MTTPPARSTRQSEQDTLHRLEHRLEHEADAWVTTADGTSEMPYLAPLPFLWNGSCLLFAAPAASPDGRGLASAGGVRVGIGRSRDAVLLDGTVDVVEPTDLSEQDAELFAAKTGFDPRRLGTPCRYFRVRPQRVLVRHGTGEPDSRELMRDGRWLVSD
ncbi:pyridoxamine 5'-phosphate oxidase family protein [Streptomyces sp. NPDC006134]|uniref:pyridoxamine 5'-phosphate oxidase family protein n=1 Tax=Streptomyces sp. NPDC006134 TaxID=3154467 RepID=UPI003405AD53